MKKHLIKRAYYKITFNKGNEKNSDSILKVSNTNGIIRISIIDSTNVKAAISPIVLNRTTRRKIKTPHITKQVKLDCSSNGILD